MTKYKNKEPDKLTNKIVIEGWIPNGVVRFGKMGMGGNCLMVFKNRTVATLYSSIAVPRHVRVTIIPIKGKKKGGGDA